jgi:hypothetical protein
LIQKILTIAWPWLKSTRSQGESDPGPCRRHRTSRWTSFIVKVHNAGNVHTSLEAESPNALLPFNSRWLWSPTQGNSTDTVHQPHSPGETANRFLELAFYKKPPLLPKLSGLNLEYMILQCIQHRQQMSRF